MLSDVGDFFDRLVTGVWVMFPLGLLIFGGTVFYMRRRFVHLAEPALIQSLVFSFGFSGFYLLYNPHNFAWWAVVLGAILGVAPFVLLYRRRLAMDSTILEKRSRLAKSAEFRIFLVIACAAIIVEALITVASSGLVVGPKIAPSLIARQGGVLNYISQAAVSFEPAFLLLTYRTRWFYLVIITIIMNFLAATVLASRVSFLLPALMVAAALFLHKLDHNTAEGRPPKTIITVKNFFAGLGGIGGVLGLLSLAGVLITGSASTFLFNFLLRLFESCDGLFMAIEFSFIRPHMEPEYSVLLAYTQPIHKLLHLNVGQVYNNIGEYIAVNVYHLNIWANPDLKLLALPNSNLVLELELSYPLVTSLVLISIYATAVICILNWSEPRRYNSLGLFCLSQYLIMNPLQFFSDGNYFVVAAYGVALLLFFAKVGGKFVDVLRWEYGGSRDEESTQNGRRTHRGSSIA